MSLRWWQGDGYPILGWLGKREARAGDYFQILSGGKFWHQDPRPEDFHISDIATALGNNCRFCGHVLAFYSVAQHSVLVAQILRGWGYSIEVQFQGLMHDAPEAYTGDAVRPRKHAMPDLMAEEARVWKVLAPRFGLPVRLHSMVKEADNVALVTERRDLLVRSSWPWAPELEWYQPQREIIVPWEPAQAGRIFLQRFYQLGGVA